MRYVRDYYGEGHDSELSAGIGTDRFVVEWRIAEERVARLAERGEPEPVPEEHAAAPVVNMAADPPDPPAVRLEVPADILEVRRHAPEEAARWRAATRHAFETLLARGYEVAGFHRGAGGRSFYVLTRPAP
jgi:predicted GNAT superfamily acetyltransferase